RHRVLGDRLRGPATVAMDHAHRLRQPIERQLRGTLVEDLTVDVAGLLRGEEYAERRDRVGTAAAQPLLPDRGGLRVLRRRHRAGHARVGRGGDHVRGDILRGVLHRHDACERDDAELGRPVVRLADIAEQTGGRRDHDDPAVLLLAEQVDSRTRHVEMSGQVDVDHRLPVVRRHLVEHAVPQDAGRVEDDMATAELVTGLFHHLQAVFVLGDRAVVRDGLAALFLDLVDDVLRRGLVATLAAAADTRIVHHYLGAVRRQPLRHFGADAAAGAGADRHTPVEHTHIIVPPNPSWGWVGRVYPR